MRYMSFLLFITLFLPILSEAQISGYKSTDNEGLNKKERIDSIEKYLSDLSGKLKDIETKVESDSKTISSLEKYLSNLSNDLKKNQEDLQSVMSKLTPKKIMGARSSAALQVESLNEESSDLDKIKLELASMKNQDLEKLKMEITKIKDKIQEIELNKSIPSKK